MFFIFLIYFFLLLVKHQTNILFFSPRLKLILKREDLVSNLTKNPQKKVRTKEANVGLEGKKK